MFKTNAKKVNTFNTLNTFRNKSTLSNNVNLLPNHDTSWLQRLNIDNHQSLFDHYSMTCQKNQQQNKWVLIINPDEASIEQLSSTTNIDPSKILCTKANTEILTISLINKILLRGNCSAVILTNTTFAQHEIEELTANAKIGETQCILLKTVLH